MNIICSDPRHGTRTAEPDWRDVVAVGTKATDGFLCPACDRLRRVEVQAAEASDDVTVEFKLNGEGTIRVPLAYSADGTVIGVKEKTFRIQDHTTAAERSALASIRNKIIVWLRNQ